MKQWITGVGIALGAMMGTGCGAKTGLVVPCIATYQIERPQIMFVIDRSGSMAARSTDGRTSWEGLVTAMREFLPQLQGTADVGVTFFPASNAPPEDPCIADTAPTVAVTEDVGATLRAIEFARPSGGTPTFEGLRVAFESLRQNSRPNRVIVLVTDGGAACNGELDTRTCTCAVENQCRGEPNARFSPCLDQERIVDLVSRARRDGITVIAVGILEASSSEYSRRIFEQFLNQVAAAGGFSAMGTGRFYPANRAREAGTALLESIATPTHCRLRESRRLRAAAALTSNLTSIRPAEDQPNGWVRSAADPSIIELRGEACTTAIQLRISEWRASLPSYCHEP
ncbi:MAG: VWA domain-containing protein [Myxococcales bacterium]|nr:VWA domain-containing protein [Myxococcales bacterium]